MIASTNPIIDELNRLVALGILQDTIFPILNILGCLFTTICTLRMYRLLGYVPAYMSLNLPVALYFGSVYALVLLGKIDTPAVWLRGPLVLLLIFPGIAAYFHVRGMIHE